MARILIRTATIVSVDPNVGDLQRGNILVDGGKIAAISGSIAAEDAEIIDASNQIANPGFIDTHRCPEDERPLAIHGVQRVFHFVELVWLDDGFNFLHRSDPSDKARCGVAGEEQRTMRANRLRP